MRLNQSVVVACWFVVILIQVWWCHACRREERLALLQLRTRFNVSSSYGGINPEGSPWEKSVNCCEWIGIKCDSRSGRVTHIDLSGSRTDLRDGYLSISLFHPFEELRFLDLSGNGIIGFLENEGSKLKLSNLKTLRLSDNHFSNNGLSFLEGLSSLRNLSLDYNRLRGSFNITKLAALKNLEVLDLSGNQNITKFVTSKYITDPKYANTSGTGVFPYFKTFYLQSVNLTGTTFYQEFYRFTNVEELHLDNSVIDANFFLSFDALPSLKFLSYGYDRFDLEELDLSLDGNYTSIIFETAGKMHSLEFLKLYGLGLVQSRPLSALQLQGLCNLKHLRLLDLRENNLNNKLPQCLANMTLLQYLDLSFNSFVGNLSSSPLNKLTSIQDLRLGYNHFQIPYSLLPFYNYSKLHNLFIEGNEFYVETESHNLIPKFQLEELYLPCEGCGGVFPKFLYYQHKLQEVDLSRNKMRGEFPYWLLENNTRLFSLHLANNSLSGPIKLPIHPHLKLTTLDISNNFFNGQIPTEFGSYFPKLRYSFMKNNNLTGGIPSSFGNLKSLWTLDLSNNKLSGRLPENLTMGCTELSSLKLSNNSLQGQIFSKNMNLKMLMDVQLGGNQFFGTIPDSLHNCSSLMALDLSGNCLFGEIPSWLGNMKFLEIIDLSRNNITGDLPVFFGASQLQEVYLSKNMLHGSFAHVFSNCSELRILDLSHNFFNDNFSKFHGYFSKLSFLLLSHNNLVGEIPVRVCKLKELSLLDLSNNSLFGRIPHCLRSSSYWSRRQHEATSDNYGPPQGTNNGSVAQPIEFTTKTISYSYRGEILTLFSGIDLSCNKLMGQIPPELGNLDNIKVLNLSHNSLRGPIPSTFSNLKEIESLDLSYNNLEGHIPPQLTQLYSLSSFSVAHNNLSGKTPNMVKQFATFENISYEGNPFLCGKPLSKSCEDPVSIQPLPRLSTDSEDDDGGFMDMGVFYVSFVVSYVIVLLGIVAVLYINPYWRRVWLYFIEEMMLGCQYFTVDICSRLFRFLALWSR